jgi:cellulose 1,4-beta-cellobiosidase
VVLTAASFLSITPQASASPPTQLCGQYQHLPVTNKLGQSFIVRNDNFGGLPECISNSGSQANFVVTQSLADSGNGHLVQAFPYIFLGCSWGLCTPASGLPATISALPDPRTSWYVSARAGGLWDATYDIWFNKQPITTGQATGAELMIWLTSHGEPKPPRHATIVWADHARWYLRSWITHNDGFKWRLIQFRRVHPVQQVTNLRLSAFIGQLEAHRWVQPSYWMLNVDAGFEICHGGVGLATHGFRVRLS